MSCVHGLNNRSEHKDSRCRNPTTSDWIWSQSNKTHTPHQLSNVMLRCIIDLFFNSTGVLIRTWLFCIQHFLCSVIFWFMLGIGVEVWMEKIFYISSLRAKLIMGPLDMPKWVNWPSMNQYRMFFFETSTPTPIMHQKTYQTWKVMYYMQNNTLSTKTPAELMESYSLNGLILFINRNHFQLWERRLFWKRWIIFVGSWEKFGC